MVMPLHRSRITAGRRKDVSQFDGYRPVRRPHEIEQGFERRHLIRCAVGERHRCQLWRLSSGQTELDPPAEEQAGGDAVAAANLQPRIRTPICLCC
jgi:hypothetical protein